MLSDNVLKAFVSIGNAAPKAVTAAVSPPPAPIMRAIEPNDAAPLIAEPDVPPTAPPRALPPIMAPIPIVDLAMNPIFERENLDFTPLFTASPSFSPAIIDCPLRDSIPVFKLSTKFLPIIISVWAGECICAAVLIPCCAPAET